MRNEAMTRAIGCAVLAAGASRRLGRPKQLVPAGGVPLIRRAALAASESRCQRVVVILGARAAEIAPALDGLTVERLVNRYWTEGMASSVRAAVMWARKRALDALLLSVGDQPAMSALHLDALIAASGDGLRAAASSYAGVLGVPALFPRSWYPRLALLRGDQGARHLLRAADDVTAVEWRDGAVDLDTPDQLPPADVV
jgi:CTP:molybdopterin cytidylyltransferase MocA